jgi:superfamily I DNA/RNA helicase
MAKQKVRFIVEVDVDIKETVESDYDKIKPELVDLQKKTDFRHEKLLLALLDNPGESLYLLSENLKALMEKEPLASVAIITHDQEEARRYHELLQKYEIPSLRIVEDQEFAFKPGIDICEIFQVKGLEFDYVIMLDVDTVNYPLNSYSRYLVHIGATRAAHQLWIMNYRQPSLVLPEWLTENARR